MHAVLVLGVVLASACGRKGFQTDAGTPGMDGPPATSCVGLAETCGPAGDRPCCESSLVTGELFYRSYDVATDMYYADLGYRATVSDFRLDRYEVTVGRFRQFVLARHGTQENPPAPGAGAHPHIANSGWDPSWTSSLVADSIVLDAVVRCNGTYQTWTNTPAGNESRPMNCVSWYEAMAFCAWDGGFLPTEAEWNYAASGGREQRAYPWSSPPGSTTIDCALTNAGGVSWPTTACVVDGATQVGSRSPAGDGLWGHADLAGNLWEWVLDWHAPYLVPCADCANLTPATDRVIRGGAFESMNELRTGYRNFVPPADRYRSIGFRCAR